MSSDSDYEISANLTTNSLHIVSTSQTNADGEYIEFSLYGKELQEIMRALYVLDSPENKQLKHPSL